MPQPSGTSPRRAAMRLAAAGWILTAAAGVVCAVSWFVPFPRPVVEVAFGVVLLGAGVVGVAAYRQSRRGGGSFAGALRVSARTAWGWLTMFM